MNYDSTNHILNPDPFNRATEREPIQDAISGIVIDSIDPLTSENRDFGYSCEYIIKDHYIEIWNLRLHEIEIHDTNLIESALTRIREDIIFDTPSYQLPDEMNIQLVWENNGWRYRYDGNFLSCGPLS